MVSPHRALLLGDLLPQLALRARDAPAARVAHDASPFRRAGALLPKDVRLEQRLREKALQHAAGQKALGAEPGAFARGAAPRAGDLQLEAALRFVFETTEEGPSLVAEAADRQSLEAADARREPAKRAARVRREDERAREAPAEIDQRKRLHPALRRSDSRGVAAPHKLVVARSAVALAPHEPGDCGRIRIDAVRIVVGGSDRAQRVFIDPYGEGRASHE